MGTRLVQEREKDVGKLDKKVTGERPESLALMSAPRALWNQKGSATQGGEIGVKYSST